MCYDPGAVRPTEVRLVSGVHFEGNRVMTTPSPSPSLSSFQVQGSQETPWGAHHCSRGRTKKDQGNALGRWEGGKHAGGQSSTVSTQQLCP